MAINLMGFKKVEYVKRNPIRRDNSIYLPLLREIEKNGGIYMLDTQDDKRAATLATTIRKVIKRFGIKGITVTKRYTLVYVLKEEDNDK